jgi:hypothetical protein
VSIEARREALGHVLFTYFGDIETLIIKLPSEAHERAHLTLGGKITLQALAVMQLHELEFMPVGSTTYRGRNISSKESDSCWKNVRIRSTTGAWPTLVIEAGMSESLLRLRSDAKWWIEHSARQVNIVILIWIRPACKKIKIEKWVPGTGPATRTSPRFAQSNAFPTRVTEINIDQSTAPSVIMGAPLLLEFDKVFARPAKPAT